jgi:peptidoglycan/LPS O-acetylase OafA/YrhL
MSTETMVGERLGGGEPAAGIGVSGPARAADGRIPELDGLRGLAILLVLLGHYIGLADRSPLPPMVRHFLGAFGAGWIGVDLFFVLSGFLIGGILLDARTSPHYFRTFYLRRVFRILPVYYLWTLLYALIVVGAILLFPGRTSLAVADLKQVPIQLLFLRNIIIGGMPPLALAWFMATWSLAVEEQFYLLAPPLIRFVSLRKLVIVLIAVIAVLPAVRLLLIHYLGVRGILAAYFTMPCRADSLAWGILLAAAWRWPACQEYLKRRRAPLQVATGVLLAGVCVLLPWFARPNGAVTLSVGLSWLGLFFSALLLLVLSQTKGWVAGCARWRALRSLGAVSYCVYVIHTAVNTYTNRLVLGTAPQLYNAKGVGVTLLSVALTLGIAALSWRFFEKPLIRRGHRYRYGEALTS